MIKYDVYNLEQSLPTVKEGQALLHKRILEDKKNHYALLKIIHGYGSTGVGGALKTGVQKSLASKKKQGIIRGYLSGERFSPFDEIGRELLALYPALSKDKDLLSGNEGITIVLL